MPQSGIGEQTGWEHLLVHPEGNSIMKHLIVATTLVIMFAQLAHAEERFVVIERDDTLIRVDTETGRVSFCNNENSKPVCKVAADEREAWMSEVDNLELRIGELQKQVESLRKPSSGKDDKELDKALESAETMMRRFFSVMKELKKDLESN